MSGLLPILVPLLGLASPDAGAQEEFKYPPPELGPEYVAPETAFPAHRELMSPLADAGVVVLAILVATWFAHRRRSRTGLLFLSMACLAWFGFVKEGCVCAIGSLQNVTEALVDPTAPILPATIVLFLAPLLTTLWWGRTFCAAVCPLGAIQELVLLRPRSLPAWLSAGLAVLPYAYLGLAVLYAVTGGGYVICRYDPFVGLFRLGATTNMLVVGACLVLIAVFVGRPYCRFLCPYGVLLGWAGKVSKQRITITPDACISCRLCEETCPYGALHEPNEGRAGESRFRGRRALVTTLVLAPVVVVAMGWLWSRLGPELATVHPRVALAAQVEAEDAGRIRETTDASDVFRASGETTESLLADAARLTDDFVLGGWLIGLFVGLAIAWKLVALSTRRTRVDYTADRQHCLACGRCFDWCPVEHERRLTGTVPEVKP